MFGFGRTNPIFDVRTDAHFRRVDVHEYRGFSIAHVGNNNALGFTEHLYQPSEYRFRPKFAVRSLRLCPIL